MHVGKQPHQLHLVVVLETCCLTKKKIIDFPFRDWAGGVINPNNNPTHGIKFAGDVSPVTSSPSIGRPNCKATSCN